MLSNRFYAALASLIVISMLLPSAPVLGVPRARCVITFDDGFKSAALVAMPVLAANGQRAVSFVIPARINYNRYMTEAQLGELYAVGWDISSHTMTHPNLNHLSAARLEYEVNGAYDWLMSRGFTRSAGFMAYPFGYGYNNATVLSKVAEHNVFGRTTQTGEYRPQLAPALPLNCIVRGYELYNFTLVSDVTAQIDRTIAEGGVLVLCMHTVLDSGTEFNRYSTSTADLKAISDYLAACAIDVVTFSDLSPVVQPPPPTPPPTNSTTPPTNTTTPPPPPPPPAPVVKSYRIILADVEGGSYKVSPKLLGVGSYSVPVGKTVYFGAVPDAGYRFSHWVCLTDYNGDGLGWDKTTLYYKNPQYFMSTSTNRLFQLTPVYVKTS